MKTSVILSTYNSPAWLEKVLWGYHCQSRKDFELVIADDGSTEQTAELIDKMRTQLNLPIKHVWQKDDGFRKSRILNKAVLQSTGDYILFSDGDCIPRKDFVDVHVRGATPGRFLSGSYYKLPMSTSQYITQEHITNGDCFNVAWLRAHGLPRTRKTYKLSASTKMAPWLNQITTVKCNFKGSNASAWKSDILAVNGFDERMPWGGQDREFGVRLTNSGIRGKHVRFDAIVVHLDHSRGYADPEVVKANKALRLKNQVNKVCVTQYGIDQLKEHDQAG